MNKAIKQTLLLLIISAVLGVGANLIPGYGIPMVGYWPDIDSDSINCPPDSIWETDSPPCIELAEAVAKYQDENVLFIDVRDPEDYEYGHIEGAMNIPSEVLDDYWDAASSGIPLDMAVVVYCSGPECDLSLLIGREMTFQGYENIFIFHGGWYLWEKNNLPSTGEE